MNNKPFQTIVTIVLYLAIATFACLMFVMACEPNSKIGDYAPIMFPIVFVIFISFYLKE